MVWDRRLTYAATFACFAATAFLVAGMDFSSLTRVPPPPLEAESGDTVVLDVQGTLTNGTTFLDDRQLVAVLGNGTLVPGLETQLEGMTAGQGFNVNVPPEQGYGVIDPTRISFQARNENVSREWSASLDAFEAQLGPPYVGEIVHGRVLDSVVVSTGDPVILRYQITVGQVLHVYRYWQSRVTATDNQTVYFDNLLHQGDQFHLTARRSQTPILVRVTNETADGFTLDSNPALAGQTLHFSGKLVQIRPGTGVRRLSGFAMSLSNRSCESCHGGAGFNAISAQASAQAAGNRTILNVTIEDPWLHDVQAIAVTASAGNLTPLPAASQPPDLPSGGSTNVQLVLPPIAAHATVQVTINATAHHVHQSGGKPNDLPYQLNLNVPVGAPRQGNAAPKTSAAIVTVLGVTGRATGFMALGVLAAAAIQGYRRHLRKKHLLRLAPWLTTHLAFSLLAIAVTLVHAEALMSGSWHGNWSWGVVLGAAALIAMGLMGITGIGLAGWTRWPRLRRIHFYLMVAVVVLSLVHTWAIGTDLKFLR